MKSSEGRDFYTGEPLKWELIGEYDGADAQLEALKSQLADLRQELGEYEQLKSADLSAISVASFDVLADGLIKARIAAGLSQRALAERLNLKEQQIQRYEAEGYASASYRRLCEVAHALGVQVEKGMLFRVVPV